MRSNGLLVDTATRPYDPERAFGLMATSDDPFAQRSRELVKDAHGADLASDPPPRVELISDVNS